jgi:hypothetical protein
MDFPLLFYQRQADTEPDVTMNRITQSLKTEPTIDPQSLQFFIVVWRRNIHSTVPRILFCRILKEHYDDRTKFTIKLWSSSYT